MPFSLQDILASTLAPRLETASQETSPYRKRSRMRQILEEEMGLAGRPDEVSEMPVDDGPMPMPIEAPAPIPVEGPAARRPSRGEYAFGQLKDLSGQERSDALDNLRGEYDEWTQDPARNQKGWRLAAAIGSSLLRPLREGGVPQMLATSQDQRDWQARGKALSDRMASEYDLEKERIKSRTDFLKSGYTNAAELLKPSMNERFVRDDYTGESTTILDPGEKAYGRDADGRMRMMAENYDPLKAAPGDRFRLEDGSTFEGGLRESGGDILAADPDVAPYAAPSTILDDDRMRKIAEGLDKTRKEIAEAANRTSTENTRIRGAYGLAGDQVRAAAMGRSKTDSSPKTSATALKEFQTNAQKLIDNLKFEERKGSQTIETNILDQEDFLNDPTMRNSVQLTLDQLRNLWLAEAEGLAAQGIDIGREPDWPDLLSPSEDFSGTAGPELSRRLQAAIEDGVRSLGEGSAQAQAAAASDDSEISTEVLTQEEFIEDFTANVGRAPSETEIEKARAAGYWQ